MEAATSGVMYSFEGQFRLQPQVRLGGNSGAERREQAIQRAQQDRSRRAQTERHRDRAAGYARRHVSAQSAAAVLLTESGRRRGRRRRRRTCTIRAPTATSAHLRPRWSAERVDDDDSDDEMADAESPEQREEADTLQEALVALDWPEHVLALRRLVDGAAKSGGVAVRALCGLCYHLISRERLALHTYHLLYTLAFSKSFLRRL